jgi:hypothetical protein
LVMMRISEVIRVVRAIRVFKVMFPILFIRGKNQLITFEMTRLTIDV